jgi:hypothetical protein
MFDWKVAETPTTVARIGRGCHFLPTRMRTPDFLACARILPVGLLQN